MAYSNLAQLRMLASDRHGGDRTGASAAIALAERLDETEILVHALNNVGTAELVRGLAGGRATAGAQPRAGARRRASRSTSPART